MRAGSAGAPFSGDLREVCLSALVSVLTEGDPRREALSWQDAEWSAARLADESARIARALRELGVRPGTRVALWLPNIPAWLAGFFACVRLGAIAVSVNTRFRAHEVGDILHRSGAEVLVLWPDFHGIDFARILSGIEPQMLSNISHIVTYGGSGETALPVAPAIPVSRYEDCLTLDPLEALAGHDGDRCIIFTTSGTTRAPKFVCHTQQSVLTHAREVVAGLGMAAPGRRLLQALPMCGVFGFTQALAALVGQAPVELMEVFDAERAARLIQTRGITDLHAVDDMIDALLKARNEAIPFPSLTRVGFAAFNPELEDIVAAAEQRGLKLCGLYGMSECHALFAIQPVELPQAARREGGGRPISASARVRIRDVDSGALLASGETGEIELSGPSVMLEYFGNPEATREAFTADGFLRTGDLGYLENDGRFRYLARKGDVLRLGGFLVSPLEIEAVIDSHDAVSASQVVAVSLEGRSRPVAFVVVRPGAAFDAAALQRFCQARLARYKVPQRWFPIEAFPTTASANGTKIQKARLRALAEQALAEGAAASV